MTKKNESCIDIRYYDVLDDGVSVAVILETPGVAS